MVKGMELRDGTIQAEHHYHTKGFLNGLIQPVARFFKKLHME